MMPILKNFYKDEEALKAAYKRQLLFFNTQLSWTGGGADHWPNVF